MCIKLGIEFLSPLVVVQGQAPPKYKAIFELNLNNLPVKGENMSATMQVGHYGTVTVQWVDNFGNPAPVDATVWQSSDPTIVECTADASNPLTASIHAVGPIGPVQIQATADADLGEGVKSITAMLDMSVIAGEASAGSIDFTDTGTGPAGRRK